MKSSDQDNMPDQSFFVAVAISIVPKTVALCLGGGMQSKDFDALVSATQLMMAEAFK